MSYETQVAWRQIQDFLPKEMHFGPGYAPVEDWWDHTGHKIHLDRFRNPDSAVRIILFHGVGTNGRQISMIVGGPLWKKGFETVAVDMPGYGATKVAPGRLVTYDDWVRIASAFIDAELSADPRPIILYGLSAGGMLTYHAAALNRKPKGIIGMTFLDQRVQRVRDETARNLFMSRIGGPLATLTAKTPMAGMKVPMQMVSKMSAEVNDKQALKIFLRDKTSAGSWASMRFISSYLGYQPAIEPEAFDICPILLTQPAADRWTPLHLSAPFLKRITKVPTKTTMLGNAGHYPLEQPGLTQLVGAIEAFIGRLTP